MKRSLGVTLAAVVQFAGSAFTLLMAIGHLVGFAMSNRFAPNLPFIKAVLIVGGCFYLALGSLGTATAIGVLALKRWARISTLIFGWILIVIGVLGALSIFAVPMPVLGPSTQHIIVIVKLVVAAVFGLFAIIGGWWAWLFTRANVREQFKMPSVSAK